MLCARIVLQLRPFVCRRPRAASSTDSRTSRYDAVAPAPTMASRNSVMTSGSRRRSEPPRRRVMGADEVEVPAGCAEVFPVGGVVDDSAIRRHSILSAGEALLYQ